MSIVSDILSLAGVQPTPAPVADQADGADFAGMLQGAEGRPSRGLMGVGRRLAEQAQAETAGTQYATALAGAEGVIVPGVLPSLQTTAETPQVNPGPATGAGADAPAVGLTAGAAKPDAPQINPGPIEAKPDAPLVQPGEAAGKGGPEILPEPPTTPTSVAAEVLNILGQAGAPVRAQAAVAAVRQAVGRAPEVSTPEASQPQAATAEAAEALTLFEVVPAGADLAAASPATTTAVAAAPAAVGQSAAAPVEAAAAGPRAEASEATADLKGAVEAALPDAEAVPVQAAAEVSSTAVRTEPVPMHRVAADAIAQVSAQIIRRLEGRATRFDMELNPVELGRVEVRLDIDSEGRLAARLAFDNPAAAAELRGRVDDLRRELEQAGFQMSDDAFSFADREHARDRRDAMADGMMRSFARSAETTEEADLAAQPALRLMTRMGLDVRV